MGNILTIFVHDLKRLGKNVIALIVVVGLSIVPSLYAWFNIAASWDPYTNTDSLKIAVANTDKGYQSSLIPFNITLGEMVISNLRANHQLDWQFVEEDDAVEGVKSGKYYAAIVIPESFSQDMMSLFSGKAEPTNLRYYLNEKENAIAPKVTDKGANAVREQIDEIFVKTVSQVGLTLLDNLSDLQDEEAVQTLTLNLSENMEDIISGLDAASATVKAFSDMIDSIQQTLGVTNCFLEQAGVHTQDGIQLLNDTQTTVNHLENAASVSTEGISKVFEQGNEYYGAVSEKVNTIFASLSKDSGAIRDGLIELSDEVQEVLDRYISFRTALENTTDVLPDIEPMIRPMIKKVDQCITRQQALKDKLQNAANELQNTTEQASTYQQELADLAKQSATEFSDLRSDYELYIKQPFLDFSQNLSVTGDSTAAILQRLGEGMDNLTEMSGQVSDDLEQVNQTLEQSAALLDQSSSRLKNLFTQLYQAAESGDFQQVKQILGSGTESLSGFLAAPVQLKLEKLYPVENYGSAMAPFYSTLSIWVGGIVLAAMLKANVSDSFVQQLKHIKNYQLYLGRYLIFLLIGLMQATLICLGDLFFLEIQCKHPFYFLIAGWVSSLVYVNIIYTLTVSFGDIGKAISVVLLVMQVAGSGGTFPIEVAPTFFQKVYPFLPFVHSMGAMRECIAGFYQNSYIIEIGKLLLFLIPSLLLGLVLRKPVIRFNRFVSEKLEDTKLM